MFDVVFLCG